MPEDAEHPFKSLVAGILGHARIVDDQLHPRKLDRTNALVTQWAENIEADMAAYVGPLLEAVATDERLDPKIRDAFSLLTGPEHQTQIAVVVGAAYALVRSFVEAAVAPFVQDVSNVAWQHHQSLPLTPDLLAAAVLKGVWTTDQAGNEAALTGIDADRFGVMVETAGQAIGLAEALLLWRRGQITDDHLTDIIRYSNLNPKFYDDVRKLRYAPPGAGAVIDGLLKAHLSEADAATKLGEAGTDPANLPWLLASAGRPIGIEQAAHLWKRGVITEARLNQIVAQSDVNPDYLPEVKLTAIYHPPVRTVVALIRQGAVTEARGRQLLAENGVEAADIDAYVAGAHHTAASTQRHLTAAQVVRMYEARLLDKATALAKIVALGFPNDEANLMLTFADDSRAEKLLNAAITKIGTAYVARRITKTDADTALVTMGLPATAAGDYFAIWDIERTTLLHHLTPAQIIGGFRREQITALQCKNRLLALGVDPADLGILVADGWPPGHADDARAAATAVVNA